MPAKVFLPSAESDYLRSNVMTIEELAGRKRRIALRGGALPLAGAAWAGKNNVVTTWYPGNPQGSQQVLGPQLLPSEWDGEWTRTRLGRTPVLVSEDGGPEVQLVRPETIADLFESIRDAGCRLRVSWRNLVREGRLAEFSRQHGKTTDIIWNVKFEWASRGNPVETRVLKVRGKSTTAWVDDFVLEAERTANLEPTRLLISNRPAKLPPGTPNLTLGQLNMMLDAPKKLTSQFCRAVRRTMHNVNEVGSLVQKASNLPYSVANTVLAEVENTIAICNDFVDSMSREPREKLVMEQRVSAVLDAAAYYGTATTQARYLSRNAVDARESVRSVRARAQNDASNTDGGSGAVVGGNAITMHVVKSGDTLPSLSLKYYGTPGHALDIALANGIDYPPVYDETGIGGRRVLLIPVLGR